MPCDACSAAQAVETRLDSERCCCIFFFSVFCAAAIALIESSITSGNAQGVPRQVVEQLSGTEMRARLWFVGDLRSVVGTRQRSPGRGKNKKMRALRGGRNKIAGGGAWCRYRLPQRKENDDWEGKKKLGVGERFGVDEGGAALSLVAVHSAEGAQGELVTAGFGKRRAWVPVQSMGSFPEHLIQGVRGDGADFKSYDTTRAKITGWPCCRPLCVFSGISLHQPARSSARCTKTQTSASANSMWARSTRLQYEAKVKVASQYARNWADNQREKSHTKQRVVNLLGTAAGALVSFQFSVVVHQEVQITR